MKKNKTHLPRSWVRIGADKIENWTWNAPCGQAGNVRWNSWSVTPTCRACLRFGPAREPLPEGVTPQ